MTHLGLAPPGGPLASRSAGSAPGGGSRRRRPGVLDAATTAEIPLRPLTIAEVLDAGFVVLRRRARLMIGLPLALLAAVIAQGLVSGLAVTLLGELTSSFAVFVLAGLGQVVVALVIAVLVVWSSAVLSRAAIHTLLGPGFAPAPRRFGLSLRMLPGIAVLALLQGVAAVLLQSVLNAVLLLVAVPFGFGAPEGLLWPAVVLGSAASLIATCIGYSYVTLATPAYMAESRHMTGWIGKPWYPTSPITALGRSVQLIGLRQAVRAGLVLAAAVLLCLLVTVAGSVAGYALLSSLLYTFDRAALEVLLLLPETVLIISGGATLLGAAVAVAYLAAAQTALYLDLRMRREGLDLALRFDAVEIPQPSARRPLPPPPSPQPPAPQLPGPRGGV